VSEVKAHPTLVVVGETGSGKTTQVRCAKGGEGVGVWGVGGRGAGTCGCDQVCVCA
jgi:HrpA-like RNA helicase